MSYEGRTQCFCRVGHLTVRDAYDSYTDGFKNKNTCSAIRNSERCGEPIVLENEVDDTNCEAYGEIPRAILLALMKEPAKVDMTGKPRRTDDETYEIPTPQELNYIRYAKNADGDFECLEIPGVVINERD